LCASLWNNKSAFVTVDAVDTVDSVDTVDARYKHEDTVTIFNKNSSLTEIAVSQTNINVVFISTLHILFITLVKNCTNTPLPVAHVKS
jgi:dUTPase